MGQNNRQRRAAKQRRRAREQRGGTSGPRPQPGGGGPFGIDPDEIAAGAADLLLGRALRQLALDGRRGEGLRDFLACAARHQQQAVDGRFTFLVERLFDVGWTPLDLYEAVRRKASRSAVAHLLDVAASATARHPDRLVHPRWRAQLDQLGARLRPPARRSAALDWAARAGLDWPAALEQLIDVLTVACSLPVVEQVLPRPGSPSASAPTADGIDAKVLRRVRGLLAKAESTEHEDEADALTAKAQELMTRYSIERALAESRHPARATPEVRRVWLDNPYFVAKSLLVSAVADANHCRSILSERWGFDTIIGHDADLDVVELLTTSLLVQATRAMTLAGPQTTRYGTSRTRSFRQSFLVAYAGRIGERLRESAETTEAAADFDRGGALLPVLAARGRLVDDKVGELFPELTSRDVAVSNAAGWGAGRAAADLALFDIRDAVTGRRAG